MPTIRPFEPRDAESVGAVVLSIQRDEFGIAITREAQPDLADIVGFYRHGKGNFWVAVAEGRVVGTIGLLDIGNEQAALRKMFVAAPYRGRSGIAQALLEALVDWAASAGIAVIYLGTTDRFLAAHRFYAKHGFSEIDRSLLPPAFPIMAVDSRFFRLRVPEEGR